MAAALVQLADGDRWEDVFGGHDALMWLWGTLMVLTWIALVVCMVWLTLLHGHEHRAATERARRERDEPPTSGERRSEERRERELVG
jgi:hypothetical protein